MNRWMFGTAIAVVALVVGACMGAGIVELSPDTYRLSRADSGGRYADAAPMKASVINDANAFAKSRGRVAVPVSVREETVRFGHLSTIDYEFRLVAPREPTPTPAAPAQRPDAVADQKERRAVDVQPTSKATEVQPAGKTAEMQPVGKTGEGQPAGEPQARPDLYTELLKLDDLRKRGILTEEEFQALKAKLLAGK